jgi:uncharacterized membrane protein
MTRGDGESDTKETLGGPRGVHVQTSVTLAWPRHEVYRWWRTLTNLPAVFRHVRRIEALEGDRTRWAVAGPAGLEVSWDAEIINDVPDTLIGWRSLRGSDVSSAGSVHFNDAPGHGTTVTVRLQYEPPAGKAGAWVASLFGADAETQIREDLEQLQRQIAMGETPAETSSGRSSAHV